jgi:hypothetical protein
LRRLLWLTLLLVAPNIVAAENGNWYSRQTTGVFGLKAGVINGGSVRIGQTYETEIGLTGQAFFDLPLRTNLFAVTALDFYDLRLDADSKWMLDINLGLKPSYYLRRIDTDIKPALSVGWGHLEMDSTVETSDFLMVRLSCEGHFYIHKKRAWVLEAAMLYAPWAANDQYPDATIGPLLLLRAGVAFR